MDALFLLANTGIELRRGDIFILVRSNLYLKGIP